MNPSNTNRSGTSVSLVQIVIGGILIIAGGFFIGTLTPNIVPVEGSAEAQQVDGLFRFMLVIGAAIFLLVNGVLAVSIIRFRARANDYSDGPPIQGNTTLEFVWTLIPAIIVTVLTLYAYSVWNNITSVKPNEQVVDVTGQRFAWTFTYDVTEADLGDLGVAREQLSEDVNASFVDGGALTFNYPQLATWVGKPVHVQLHTQDVNHAFWIPGMRIKQDLLAGRVTDIRFTPIEAGVYRIVCAELCGSGHGDMAGTVDANGNLRGAWLIVYEDEETYMREFYRPEAQNVLFPPEDPVALGRQILAAGSYPCASCHVLSDLGWQGNVGPNLDDIGNRAATRRGGFTAEEYLANSIRHPGEYVVPGYGNLMPQFNPDPALTNYMPDDHLNAIVAYLLTQQAG
ncbi:MAG: cytochrome c oxidase subunit II [Anaerolineae bacterium]|uniref:cytochrome c oxidase subunit II n=1 Tax=Candidatus Flexifilum breve TaxID=3140694 RepID=UPI001AC3E5A9|nr:cytochrome c oxidase subunit II [Chloroflexota bacterium]MBK9747184.1 cytochrome c oxidase subunit II [Chloroflexota bacterium]MBN8637529.1 cytochrome c oxidase subunit II [Anaerolineae bacterium]